MDRGWDAGSPAGAGMPGLPPELDPRGRRRHHRRIAGAQGVMHSSRIIVRIVAAALSLFIVVYIGYLWNTVRGLNDVQRLKITLGGQQVDSHGHTVTRNDIDGKDQNLLIAGNDDRSALTDKQVRELKVGRDGGSLNTDTMMIVHVPADGSKATLISLPRDSYVNIPGYGMNKLNSAYPFGYNNAGGDPNAKRAAGANLLIQVVENLTGLNIDHFVQVSLLGFVTISDAVGGVTVDMCKSVNDTVPHNRSIGLTGGSGLVLSKGRHTIHGVQALEFVRQREGLPRGDVDRTARQRYFLTAAFRTVASAGTLLNIGKLQNLVSAVDKSIYVDNGLNMLQLAKQMSNLSANNISGEAIPTDHYADTGVGNAGIIVKSQVRAFIAKMISAGPSKEYLAATAVDPGSVQVTVRNYGTQNGAAATASAALKKAGFQTTVDPASSGTVPTTTIEYPKGSEAQAKTLARYVPGASVAQADVSTVTLTLGADGLTAKSTTTPAKPSKAKVKSPAAIDSKCIN
ncbi:MAG: LCP family protein [Jatrophihabitantaceae bacterium]